MRKFISGGLAAAVLLAATACSSGSSDTTDTAPATPKLPQVVAKPPALPEEELKPSPSSEAPFNEQVAYELRRKTLGMARAKGTTTGECPKDLGSKSGTRATCTTTYDDIKIQWDISIGDKSAWSDNYVQYTAVPRQGVLTRDGAARLMYGNSAGAVEVRCSNIPEAVAVPLNQKTKYTCQVVYKDKGPMLPEPIRVTDSGPRAY